ncbi:hypothetical protein XU18_1744 [Perkinsela sp. CCAP 1560/4]|nr:hypothetical protein XU18_2925 [Perkinsela sp. CCAP 1560/4]KNH07650.1 hypothetical protein XU18_1744 [Perkinsela sp. CCAP 1560/4]|eukprot:KNH06169.1 hypothetical protein XU18_2925 [Perkinsela sp. CCAP 1560/4]
MTTVSMTDAHVGQPKEMRGKAGMGSNTVNKKLESEITRAQEKTEDAIFRAEKTMKYKKAMEGGISTENEQEKTYLVRQETLASVANRATSKKYFNLELPVLGPYMCDYSNNGNSLLLGGRKGHIAVMDWKSFQLQSEFQLHETCTAIKYLNDEQLFAVAQSKYTYIYGSDGVEVHQLRDLANIQALEFLPQHFLLAGGSKSGILTWFDVSIGKLVSLRRSRMGPISQLCRDKSTNVLAAGHQCGEVSMWVPTCSTPVVKLAAHRSMVVDQRYDKSGSYLTTLGVDGYTRIWDLRTMKLLNQIYTPNGRTLDVSYTDLLAVGFSSRVEVWSGTFSSQRPNKPLIAHNFEKGYTFPCTLRFCPFEDVLGVGHNFGFSSLLVPGAGCADPDFYNANPFETRKQMRDRPVYQLLDKLQPDSIRLNNAPGASHMRPRNMALLKQKQILSEAQEVSEAISGDQANDGDNDIVEKEVASQRLAFLTAEAERLERQHKHERKMKKMNGVEKYKLKQRSHLRKESKETRRTLKKKRLDKTTGTSSAVGSGTIDTQDQEDMNAKKVTESAAMNWFNR